jgi:uncharacterized membrane protein (DUF2068 family)
MIIAMLGVVNESCWYAAVMVFGGVICCVESLGVLNVKNLSFSFFVFLTCLYLLVYIYSLISGI